MARSWNRQPARGRPGASDRIKDVRRCQQRLRRVAPTDGEYLATCEHSGRRECPSGRAQLAQRRAVERARRGRPTAAAVQETFAVDAQIVGDTRFSYFPLISSSTIQPAPCTSRAIVSAKRMSVLSARPAASL